MLLCILFLTFPQIAHPSDKAVQVSVSLQDLKWNIPKKVELVKDNSYVKAYVKAYFADIPALYQIAGCESKWRQWKEDGTTLKGQITPADRGVMQINLDYHPDARGVVDSLEGNLEYAKHLYNLYGLAPWKSSMGCWGGAV